MQDSTTETRTSHIFVHQPPEVVWNFFTTPTNWIKWSGMTLDMVEPRWQNGAMLIWRYGYPARILRIHAPEEIQIQMTWTTLIWRFIPIGRSFCRIEVVEIFNQGIDAPRFEIWESQIRVKLLALESCLESLPLPFEEEMLQEKPVQPDRKRPQAVSPLPKSDKTSRWVFPVLALIALTLLMSEAGATYWLGKQGLIGNLQQLGFALPKSTPQEMVIPVTGGEPSTIQPTKIPIYFENFAGKSGNWAASNGEAWVENNHLVLNGDPGLVWCALDGELNIDPYYLQADLNLMNGSGAYGIAFGRSTYQAYYQYLIDPENQRYTLRRWSGIVWEDLLPWATTDQIKEASLPNTLGVDYTQGVITLYLNNRILKQYTDLNPLPPGSIGVASHAPTGQVWADNLLVFPEPPIQP